MELMINRLSRSTILAGFITATTLMLGAGHVGANPPAKESVPPSNKSITVASYYFGNYHPNDPRNQKMKGKGWAEWELVKAAKPRFPGHQQPNVPLWGYTDESDPKVMEQKIAAAADHGIDAFIFDWYYYDDGPFLDRPIDNGFLKASNNSRIKFAFMWANHDWLELHPYKKGTPQKLMFPGTVTPANFEKICDHVIKNYFSYPSYWKIDGKPYFSFYDLSKLLANFGSVDATRAALDTFRAKVKAAGFPDVHINAVAWGQPILPSEKVPVDSAKLVRELGFDSVTSYVWIHHVVLPSQQTDYNVVRDGYFKYWDKAVDMFNVPFFPNVTMGWDSSPRCDQSDVFDNSGYPFMNTISANTPKRFRTALEMTKKRLLAQPDAAGPRILNINCWNEWTEGSYLEPDTRNGMKYLEAVREVFCETRRPRATVGAIRWDAWTGGEITKQVERTLGPQKYQDRLPWFADVLNDHTATIDGSPQLIMDREIEYAAAAGLDYWAFLLYEKSSSMSVALKQYMQSKQRDRVRFCLILHNTLTAKSEHWPQERDRAVALLKEPGYQTVLNGRPLIYAFCGGSFPFDRFNEFLASVRKEGLNPYCVYMGWDPVADFKKVSKTGFHAVSAYAKPGGQETFSDLVASVERDNWQKAVKANVPYVPLVTTGWDKRPRQDNPVSWEKDHSYHTQKTFPSKASAEDVSSHLRRAVSFVKSNPGTCEANAIIIYAWNEYDEGGWIAPTRGDKGLPDTSRLDAIQKALKETE